MRHQNAVSQTMFNERGLALITVPWLLAIVLKLVRYESGSYRLRSGASPRRCATPRPLDTRRTRAVYHGALLASLSLQLTYTNPITQLRQRVEGNSPSPPFFSRSCRKMIRLAGLALSCESTHFLSVPKLQHFITLGSVATDTSPLIKLDPHCVHFQSNSFNLINPTPLPIRSSPHRPTSSPRHHHWNPTPNLQLRDRGLC